MMFSRERATYFEVKSFSGSILSRAKFRRSPTTYPEMELSSSLVELEMLHFDDVGFVMLNSLSRLRPLGRMLFHWITE